MLTGTQLRNATVEELMELSARIARELEKRHAQEEEKPTKKVWRSYRPRAAPYSASS